LTRSQATGILNLRMDREPRLQGMGVNGPLDDNPFLRLARNPTGSGAHNVDYAELMLFDRVLSDEEVVGLEGVLMARWL
ncbi:MAG: hypothetical protein AAFS10_12225, partial [Myxococcota bacterium]